MSAPSNPHFATFVTMLIDTLAAMMPGSDDDSKETRRDIARLMFEAFQPRDAIEAMAAARAVAAHHAAMDNFARAARLGVSDETAMRLRANALAAGRSVEAMLRARDRRRKELSADEIATSGPAADRQSRNAAAAADPRLTAAGLSRQHGTDPGAAAGSDRGARCRRCSLRVGSDEQDRLDRHAERAGAEPGDLLGSEGGNCRRNAGGRCKHYVDRVRVVHRTEAWAEQHMAQLMRQGPWRAGSGYRNRRHASSMAGTAIQRTTGLLTDLIDVIHDYVVWTDALAAAQLFKQLLLVRCIVPIAGGVGCIEQQQIHPRGSHAEPGCKFQQHVASVVNLLGIRKRRQFRNDGHRRRTEM